LAGQPHIAASVKRVAGIKGDVDHYAALSFLRGLLLILKDSGYSGLVQSLSIDAFLTGANIVVLAPTAGGKTESAFFPVNSQMLTEGWDGLSVLYVSPIRALLNNHEQRLQKCFTLVGRRAACWHGDTSQGDKRRILADPLSPFFARIRRVNAVMSDRGRPGPRHAGRLRDRDADSGRRVAMATTWNH
jgi:ATP-dependent Lhr-like helicase